MKTLTQEEQANITPSSAINLLKKGNDRFLNCRVIDRNLLTQVENTSSEQFPFAIILSCIDSRIPTEVIFDQGIGDIFNARIAGNIVNDDILGSMEFACKLAGAKLIVVMGHTECGAVKGACDKTKLGNLTSLLNKLKPAVEAVSTPIGTDRSSANSEFVDAVAHKNVELTIARLKAKSPVLNEMIETGEVGLAGAMYDVASGKVTFD